MTVQIHWVLSKQSGTYESSTYDVNILLFHNVSANPKKEITTGESTFEYYIEGKSLPDWLSVVFHQ